MLANKKRKRSRGRKRAMPAGLKAYWAKRRRGGSAKRRRRVSVVHYAANKRRRRSVAVVRRRRHNPGGGGGNVPASMAGFVSVKFLTQAAMVAAGAVAPAYITDRILPMVGLSLTGWPRRLAQFAVPAVLLMVGGKRLLGKHAAPFVLGAAGSTVLGAFMDLTGGLGIIGPSPAVAGMLGRYQKTAPALAGVGVGRYSQQPKILATR